MKIKERLLSIILSICIVLGMTTNVFAKEEKVNSISNAELENTIEGIIKWAKQGNEKLLNSEFLEMAGTTPGDWFPIGVGRYGYKDDYDKYLSTISKKITERYKSRGKLHPVKGTEWHRISLAVLAMGGDPTKIGTDPEGKPVNLIADGTYNCITKKGIKGQGINGGIWSLISLDSKRYEVPEDARYSREDIIKLVIEDQLADGGFALWGNVSDVDITGMAIQSLSPYYYSDKVYTYKSKKIKNKKGEFIECKKTIKQIIDEGLDVIGEKQRVDGDFNSWGTDNVESTVQMLVALSSVGIDCEKDPRYIKNGKTLIDGIMKYRNPKDGGFLHSFKYDPENPTSKPDASNSMATEQTLYGLVSYWRLRHNMRDLYDFREEANQSEFIIKCNDNNYTIPLEKDKNSYLLEIPFGVKNLSFINIPMGPYDTSCIPLNSKIEVADGKKIDINIRNRANNTTKYEINITVTNEAMINNVMKDIYNLPENITLADEKKVMEVKLKFDKLSSHDKERIKNIKKLSNAIKKINELKKELQEEEISKKREILEKTNKLPKDIGIDDKSYVFNYLTELKNLKVLPEKEAQERDKTCETLTKLMEKIEEIEAKVKELDGKIFTEIQPMNITLKDKENVLKLQSEYEKINEKDRKHVLNYGDVLLAKKIIGELENNNTIVKDVFEQIFDSDAVYTFHGKTIDGKEYSISFNGRKITDPTISVNINISFTSKNYAKIKSIAKDAAILSFAHEGKLPGKAKVTIDVDLADGDYFLYYFNKKTGKSELVNEITVKDGKTVFEIEHCSDYFISANSKLGVKDKQSLSNAEGEDGQGEDAQVENAEIENENTSTPQTGDNSKTMPIVVLLVCSAGILFVLKRR